MEQRRSNNGADYFLLLVADFRNVHVNIISSQVVGGLEPRQGPLVFSELFLRPPKTANVLGSSCLHRPGAASQNRLDCKDFTLCLINVKKKNSRSCSKAARLICKWHDEQGPRRFIGDEV